MKVVILGASGKLGGALVDSALARGCEVTAAVRNPEPFLRARPAAPRLRILRFDAMEPESIDAAMQGQEAVVSAAGNVADGDRFVDLFDRVATAAERVLGSERRIWMLAGAAVLDIPNAGRIALGLPFVPKRYRPHGENWRRLERSRLDWALMCPGAMVASDEAPPASRLTISLDALPFVAGGWTRYAPPIALSLLMQNKLPYLKVNYRSVADVMIDGLAPHGRFKRRRVGVGWAQLPPGG